MTSKVPSKSTKSSAPELQGSTKATDQMHTSTPPEPLRSNRSKPKANTTVTNPQSKENESDSEMDKYSDSIHCDLCIQTEAENFCLSCKQYICSTCQKAHQRGTTTKDHKIVRVEDLFSASTDKPGTSEADTQGRNECAPAHKVEGKGGKAIYIEQIDISTATDKTRTIVSAIEVTEDGGLLVCDFGNQKVKLFDKDFEILSEVGLTSKPMGMVILATSDLVVSLPHEQCLQKLKVKKDCLLSLEQRIKTKLKYYRLLKYKDKILAYGHDDLYRFFNIIDTDGKTIRCIMNEPRESGGIFKNVFYISLSIDNEKLYVTDMQQGCVGISLSGKLEFTYKEPETKSHHGICGGPDNSVYVACNDSDRVVVIDNKGKKVKDLISVKGLHPAYVVYSKSQGKLFVKRGGTSKVLVYTMNI